MVNIWWSLRVQKIVPIFWATLYVSNIGYKLNENGVRWAETAARIK